MYSESLKEAGQQLIDKERWAEMLAHFIDVLRINMFLVDCDGRTIIPTAKNRYGWDFLSSSPVGMELLNEHSVLLDKFKQHGFYLEYNYLYDLHTFAIPINVMEDKTIAYIILGPVVLNHRREKSEYKAMADHLKVDINHLMESLSEIRVLSFLGIKSVLDLLDEVSRYIIQLNFQAQALTQAAKARKTNGLSKDLRDAAKDLYSAICYEELLVTFLDAALNLTKTQCGSIMIVESESKSLTIRVSRGIESNIAQKTRIQLGEGIAGLAAQDNKSFIINGDRANDERLKPFLKRPDIKHALVTPLISAQNRVFGVLNLHTKEDSQQLNETNLDAIQNLSRLTSV